MGDEIFGALIEESGSHMTRWWREMDSNHRSLIEISRFISALIVASLNSVSWPSSSTAL
jgi:hypothetical protein